MRRVARGLVREFDQVGVGVVRMAKKFRVYPLSIVGTMQEFYLCMSDATELIVGTYRALYLKQKQHEHQTVEQRENGLLHGRS